MNFFMEVSKLRAARFLWAKKMKQMFNPQNVKSLTLRTHCQTSGVSLTEKDAYNNIVRTTVEAMAAVMGGTQSLHTNSFDEAVALPTEMSSRIARNTQLILQNETSITRTVDPLAGSYYVESLTNSLIVHAEKLIDEILGLGGMTKAIENGYPNKLIEESAIRKQAKIDSEEEIIVGVNKFINENEKDFDILEIDNTEVRKEQISSIAKIKNNRNDEKCEIALKSLTKSAKENRGNLLELSIAAARERATVGEISYALEKAFGRYQENLNITKGVYKKSFSNNIKIDDIKESINKFTKEEGRKPKMLVAKLGQDGHDRGAKVIASSFSDLGFDIEITKLFLTPEELIKEANKIKPDVVGISSHAAAHMTLVTDFMNLLKLNKNNYIVICGGVIPKKDISKLKNLGVSEIFGPGTNIINACYKILNLIKYGKKSNI